MKNEICFILFPDAIGRLYLEAIKKSQPSAGGGGDTTGGGAGLPDTDSPTPEWPLFIYLGFNIYLDLTRSLPPAFKWLKQSAKSGGRGFGWRWSVLPPGASPFQGICNPEHLPSRASPIQSISIPEHLHPRISPIQSISTLEHPLSKISPIPQPSTGITPLAVPPCPLSPSSFAGRPGSFVAAICQRFPLIPAAVEGNPVPAPSPSLPPSPQSNLWFCYQREKFSPPAKV